MKVRLSRDPKRLDARLNELSRELAQAEARANRAQNLRTQLAGQREAILKSMRGRVSDLALQYIQIDARRLAAFREWASDPKQSAMLKLFFDAAAMSPADAAPSKPAKASGARRGRPPGKKTAKAAKAARGRKAAADQEASSDSASA